jgi:hypothetical protein
MYIFASLNYIYCIGEIESLNCLHAEVAELVDALDSKSSDGNIVRVRFPPSVQEAIAVFTGLPLFF